MRRAAAAIHFLFRLKRAFTAFFCSGVNGDVDVVAALEGTGGGIVYSKIRPARNVVIVVARMNTTAVVPEAR